MLGFRCLGKIQRGILAVADCTQGSFGFPACRKRAVEVDFSGGAVSSNGGVLLLRAADRRLGLSAAAARVLRDPRDPGRCRHSALTQLRQRLYGLALGYEDLTTMAGCGTTWRCRPRSIASRRWRVRRPCADSSIGPIAPPQWRSTRF